MTRTGWILVDDDSHEVIDPSVDVPAFILANDLDPDEVSAILALPVTGRRVYGGGAAPQYSLIRTGV